MKNIVVAIDGPAGSGKSSISKSVAKKLGFTNVDTGAMFRAITLYVLDNGLSPDNGPWDFLKDLKIVYTEGKTFLNGKDVSKEIREDRVTNNASAVAREGKVRSRVIDFERESRNYGNIIMDGRDIGTVVFPDADVKIYLDASPEERANRRYKENTEKGMKVDYDTLLKEIIERDRKDSTREIAPLKKADDATYIDTTKLSFEEVENLVFKLINEKVDK